MAEPTPNFVFDRDGTGHPWSVFFGELESGPEERPRALAENWRMDHRVSRDREREDLLASGLFDGAGSGTDWCSALRTYFRLRLCQPSSPDAAPRSAYLNDDNSSNLVRGVLPFDRLCHVGSLREIVRRVLTGSTAADADAELEEATGIPLPEKPAGERDPLWLDRGVDRFALRLAERGEAAVRAAARILLDELGPSEPPWWACFAEEVQPLIDARDATGLCEALGLGHRWGGEWLLVWAYPVADAGPLYRPTVAEANDSPFHFPSPPGFSLGITMPLDPARPTCREVVHRPLRGETAAAGCTGILLFLENFPPLADTGLMELRRKHHDRLRTEFGTEAVKAWLDRHASRR
jgi:hypothetical protein